MKETKRKSWANSVFTMILSFMMVWTMIPGMFFSSTAYAAAGQIPPHTKNLTDNHDGTYKLSLDVVGDSEKKPNNVNVVVIFDRSGSMNATRMSAAKNAVNSLANSLFAYNQGDPNTVQMALIDFSTHANAHNPTNSASTFRNQVDGLSASGGTNWEAALSAAGNVNFGDNDQTFVIFVSDGNPTFRDTQGTTRITDNRYYSNDDIFYNEDGVYGLGSDNPQNTNYSPQSMTYCYNHAVDDATALVNKVGADHFFTIGAYGNVSRMQTLTTAAGAPAANFYNADDTAALNQALSDILAKIEMSGIANTDIEDGTTNQVKTTSGVIAELLEVDTSSFKYYRSGGSYGANKEWTSSDEPAPPAATFKNGAVDWDLSKIGVLENGVKYTVTFDVYPSQYTYDTIAQLKNGDITYDSLDAEIKKYIVANPDGSYSLRTNTNATLSYDDTRDDAGQQEAAYTNPDPVATDAETLTINKTWEGEEPDVDSLKMTVLMDGKKFHESTLSKSNAWKDSSFISIGIIKGDKVLPGAEGHDFTFAELDDTQYHWELDAPTVHPMLVDGTLKMLVKVDAKHPASGKTYTIDGAQYYVDEATAGLTATNNRRSNLNLKKVVTGEDAPKDATFPFTLTVVNSKAPTTEPADDTDHNSDYWVWFAIDSDPSEAFVPVTDAEVSGDGVVKSGNYWYAPSGTEITVKMKADWNLRFTNLPSGSTYTFEEGKLADGFAFNKSVLTTGKDTTFKGAQTTTGTIQETKTSYQVEYTNDYQKTDLEITKVWDDAKNQDGKRLTADQLKAKLTLSPAVEGAEPTVKDNGNDTYTITYTGLPRFNNGTEVKYTVAESAIDGYTTTGSPAKDHGTITNTHEPEVTSVTVVKEWDDSDDIGKIRPAAVNVQLTADGTESGDPVALNEGNKWTYKWENLPKYKDGKEIKYAADETAVPTGYKKTVTNEGTTFTVKNTYSPKPVSVDPPVQKVITGNDNLYNKGNFTFTIEATSPKDAPMPAKTSITNTAENEVEEKTGFYEFGEITFTKPGTYTYTVKESGSVDGVTNDPAAAEGKTLTFTVKDDGTGKLTVTPTTDQVQMSFTNVYDADGEANIVVSKEITGAAWPKGKTLTLTLVGKDSAPMPEANTAELTAAGAAKFGPIKYGLADAGKTYEYTVTEDSFGKGWTGAPASITATVKVTDNGDGTLGTTVTYSPEDAKFTNTYKATGSANIEVTKAVAGAAWPKGKTLTMTLAGTDAAPMPKTTEVKLTEAGKATFGPIEYTEADAGKTYTYTISEDGFGDGWTGSGDITATVEVTDNGDGTLATKVTYSPENATVTNTYKATGSENIEVTKALVGAEWPEGKTLTFTLAGKDNAPMPESATVDLKAAGKAAFGPIAYTEADAGKTYTYEITEGSFGDGWTGSPDKITATVKVTDKGDGTLATAVTYDPEAATFTNTYDANGSIKLGATKELKGEGRTLKDGDFSFAVYDETGKIVATAKNKADGSVEFSEIQYKLADAGKTFKYTVKEIIPDGADDKHKLGNITYDATTYDVNVTVTDNKDGKLVATADKSASDVKFVNTYEPFATPASVKVKKELYGRAINAGEFSFKMVPTAAVDGDPISAEGLTATVDKDGNATLATTFTKAGTYNYTVTEVKPNPALGGVEYDETAHPVTITVVDNEGQLEATVSPESVAFKNTYTTKGDAEIDIAKVFEGKNWTDEQFTFDLYNSDNEKIDSKTLTKDEQTGKFELKDLTPGTYKYKLKEVVPGSEDAAEEKPADEQNNEAAPTDENAAPAETPAETPAANDEAAEKPAEDASQAETPAVEEPKDESPVEEAKAEEEVQTGSILDKILLVAYAADEEGVVETENGKIKYDTNEYEVTVEVTDNGDGTCKAVVTYPDGEKVTFTNQYEPNPAAVNPEATKVLTGKDLTEGMFQFRLEGNGTSVVVSNDAQGKVTFPQLSYTVKDAGKTYEYTVSEVEGDLGGVTYDTTKYTFNVSVEYDEDAGKLTATMSNADGMEFINTYKAADVTINLVAHKTLEGADLSEGEFAFVVENEAGEVVATGTNDASGNVTFGGLTFTEEGTYTYRIKEVNTEVENITYDDSVYTVTVTVKDDKNGNLVAKASVDGGSANFINTFTPPEEDEEVPPKTPGVKTGDDNNIGGWLGLMALAAAGASGLYIRRRREDQE